MTNKALVIFSGGQDSTTVLGAAIHTHGVDNVHTLTINYGQRHKIELRAARKVCDVYGVPPQNRDVLVLPDDTLHSTSPLLSVAPVAQYDSEAALPGGTEATFVEGRNILFLVLAGNRAASLGIDLILIGVGQEDFGGYPDCREGFLTRMEAALRVGLDRERLVVSAPLMQMSKRATVETAVRLSEMGSKVLEALSWSHTCYKGSVPPCGKCHACILRAKGFDQYGIKDPLLLRLSVRL